MSCVSAKRRIGIEQVKTEKMLAIVQCECIYIRHDQLLLCVDLATSSEFCQLQWWNRVELHLPGSESVEIDV